MCDFDECCNDYGSTSVHDYSIGCLNGAWWQFQQMKKKLEGCVVVPGDQAKDTARLDFMLEENRVVSTDINCDENYERTDEGFCVNAVYWIDGWDRLTTSVHKTKREAIDAAMVEAARGRE